MPEELELNGLKTQVESLIFVADSPVTIGSLARALERDDAQIEQVLTELADEYRTRGFRLQRSGERVQLVSAPEAAPYIQKFLGLDSAARLSAAALETLAIIAYRQPITRPQIEAIRGVNCDGVIHNLLARGLIEEKGRLETVGHPIQYGTTPEFLRHFGLRSLEELPPLGDVEGRDARVVLESTVAAAGLDGATEARPDGAEEPLSG